MFLFRRSAVLLFALPLLAAAATPITLNFPQRDFITSHDYGFPLSLAAGDFNNDGILDAVVGNNINDTGEIAVMIGYGPGKFRLQQTYSIPSAPTQVAVGDFNHDGKLDVVYDASGLYLMLGNGNGALQSPVAIPLNGTVTSFVVADFNNDGNPDLAASEIVNSFPSDGLAILLGNGHGGFQPPSYLTFGDPASGGNYVTAGDYNHDGRTDIAIAQNSALFTFLGNGDGTFTQHGSVTTGLSAAALVTADLDRDGNLDVVIAGGGSYEVGELYGDGQGNFAGPSEQKFGDPVYSAAVADFNGDGFPDILVGVSNELVLLPGQGHGLFGTALPIPGLVNGITIADVNGDGLPDALLAEDGLGVLFGSRNRYLLIPPTYGSGTVGPEPGLVTADFNNDGHADLLLANATANSVSFLAGNSTGALAAPMIFPVGLHPSAIVTGDFNRDTQPDVATADQNANTVSVLLNTGGSFAPAVAYPVGGGPMALVAGDFNGDGVPDLATLNGGTKDITILIATATGTFSTGATLPVGGTPTALAAGDFNGDGKLDLAAAYKAKGSTLYTLLVFFGFGNGSFQSPVTTSTSVPGSALAVSDLNGDGKSDIVVVGALATNTEILLSHGDGTFATSFVQGVVGARVSLADLNGDGFPDLVVINPQFAHFTVLAGLGNGTFQPARIFGCGSGSSAVAFPDLNGDGKPDLAFSNFDATTSRGGAVVDLNTTRVP